MRVLHVSAGPLCQSDLMVTAELRGITDALLPGKARRDTSLEVVPQARPRDLDIYLEQFKPNVLHFSGHGEPGRLLLCDDSFDEAPYDKARLVEVLRDSGVELLVLNCCESVGIAREVFEQLGIAAIGTQREVLDEEAVIFAETFYKSLQIGLSVGKSQELALRELPGAMEGAGSEGAGSEGAGSEGAGSEGTEEDARSELEPSTEFGGLFTLYSNDAKRDLLKSSRRETAEDRARKRTLQASRQLGDIRQGVTRNIKSNLWKLLSVVAVGILGTPLAVELQSLKSLAAYDWMKIDPWLLFTFFAIPPAIYLAKNVWLERPLTEAELATFNLAISLPDEQEPEHLAERAEELVSEFEDGKESPLAVKKSVNRKSQVEDDRNE